LILGASTRAAAFSALRCGLHPICADYFADRDLAAVCRVDRINPRHAARQFTELAESLVPLPWFFTGGFENHPERVRRIARRHVLWGVDAETLRAVRDPARVAEVLARSAVPAPAVRSDPRGLPRDASWLKKPRASAGGRDIEPLLADNDADSPLYYFQERIDGPSYSAVFIGRRSHARLVGTTRQITGIDGSPYAYRGSIGPLPIENALAARLSVLGNVLACNFGLAGWFGVDYILRGGIPWPVEINPRYTASVEIHELASGRPLLAEHQRACAENCTASDDPVQHEHSCSRPRIIAKLILYATQGLVVPEIVPDENDHTDVFAVRPVADVPWPGRRVNPGEPIMTLFAEGADTADCWSRMARLEEAWTKRLGLPACGPTTDPS
jgi:predicted ATP-grasp superfamily ATP-dependent carboligase